MRRLFIGTGMMLLVLLVVGCSGEGAARDPDSSRGRAKPIPACGVDTDILDTSTDDDTDYKVFQVPENGVITVTVHWDNPEIRARVSLLDKFGIILDARDRNPDTNNEIISRPIVGGVYFIELKASTGRSVYSVETKFASEGGVVCGEDEDPVPYCIELMEGHDNASNQKSKKNSSPKQNGLSAGNRFSTSSVDAAATASQTTLPGIGKAGGPVMNAGPGTGVASANAEPLISSAQSMTTVAPSPFSPTASVSSHRLGSGYPEPSGPKISRRGDVLRIAAAGDVTKVTIGLGSADNVKKGVRGNLLGSDGRSLPGGELVVEKVFDSACIGVTSLSADELIGNGGVVLRVPK